jgi:hypothetical protein
VVALVAALATTLPATAATARTASAASTPLAATTTSAIRATPAAGARPAVPAGRAAAPRPARKLPAGERQACPTPSGSKANAWTCFAVLGAGSAASPAASPTARPATGERPDLIFPGAYQPADLRSAYNLTSAATTGGQGRTVAVVDAGDDPHAAADLARYRAQWGVPACVPATGAGCVTVYNEHGKTTPKPQQDPSGGWEVEESLDMDMVSAICPNCHIDLVEADSPDPADLDLSEDTAVSLGARFVSNSFGGSATPTDEAFFNHPGVAIVASAGDEGYGTAFPASSQYVVSVGGTSLTPAPGTARGWTETAWDGTGSGCAATWAKPAWQVADANEQAGCADRTENDVSAVADPNTGVWIYDSTPFQGEPVDWDAIGGTSASAPIITATWALAGLPQQRTYPGSYLYRSGRAASLNDVTSGSNGFCEATRAYLCDAKAGYDGPTGWGTPNGTAAFAAPATATVTVADPGRQDKPAGSAVSLAVKALDSVAGAPLAYTATGLPRGLSISASTGLITGKLPAAAGTATVHVTATDPSGAHATATFQLVIIPSLRATYHRVAGQVTLAQTRRCLTDNGNSPANGAPAVVAPCVSGSSAAASAQRWTYEPDALPDGSGTLAINGKCLTVAGNSVKENARLVLAPCDGATGESWSLQFDSQNLYNPASGMCMDDPAGSLETGTVVDIDFCAPFDEQAFILPPGPVLSAAGGTCVTDPGNSTHAGAQLTTAPCDASPGEAWDAFSLYDMFSPTVHDGLCWNVAENQEPGGEVAFFDGEVVKLGPCISPTSDYTAGWVPLANGEIEDYINGLCLAVRPAVGEGRPTLVLNDCYGDLNEIFGVA